MIIRRCLVLLAFVSAAYAADPKPAPLDTFVHAPDPAFRYDLARIIPGEGYTAFVLDLTSQSWPPGAGLTDHPVWRHWLTVIKPEHVEGTAAFLFITGGSVKDAAPARADAGNVETALATHSVVAELRGVPNEPLVFNEEGKSRNEDAIIAYTWVKFLKTGDTNWPLHFPMAKAAVRAMDAVTQFCATDQAGRLKVEKFVVGGASKRGWTTWLTAAADPRVLAIVPLVIDTLNTEVSFNHHYQAYGFYSPAVKDYVEMGVMDMGGTPKYRDLMRLEDPYSYRERYTMPKLMINSAGDQYFLPDSSQFYFGGLPGEKYLRYVPNTDHSLRNSDARESLIAFYDAVLHNRPRPRFSWKFEKGGRIAVTCADQPAEVKLWQATNPDKRDFRLAALGPAYKDTPLTAKANGVFEAKIEKPAKGWTAAFIELMFPSGGKYPFKFTTPVRVTPDTLPFPLPKPSGKLPD
ncbi:MAG TPA: PhoPQ-activated pathogenicity-related family protein [Candidatus Acidoferrales bacterium]|nr:PhoPQ-activated pathogenicity-related family protein [Candidatus Acidoferrales bacterium]